MDLHQVNEYPWLTMPSRSVNTTTVLLLLFDDVFVSQVNDEDIFFKRFPSRVNAKKSFIDCISKRTRYLKIVSDEENCVLM